MAAQFDEMIGPAGHGAPSADFEISGGWAGVRSVVDVGGGTGAMLAEMLRAHPHLRGVLVDLPRTVSGAAEILTAAGVSERARVLGQSFFDPLPAGADLYVLRGILNDWPDQEAVEILRRCAAAARPDGRVVILKGGEAEGAPRALSIEMVLLGGKERTAAEFGELARQAGLEVAQAGQQPGDQGRGGYFVVECRTA